MFDDDYLILMSKMNNGTMIMMTEWFTDGCIKNETIKETFHEIPKRANKSKQKLMTKRLADEEGKRREDMKYCVHKGIVTNNYSYTGWPPKKRNSQFF